MLEEILSEENMLLAYKRVKANKGVRGIDGITIDEVDKYPPKENWVDIRDKIRRRKYKPKPVIRVEILKPNGGVRNLGIQTVVDRIIEQAIIKLLEYFNDGYMAANSRRGCWYASATQSTELCQKKCWYIRAFMI